MVLFYCKEKYLNKMDKNMQNKKAIFVKRGILLAVIFALFLSFYQIPQVKASSPSSDKIKQLNFKPGQIIVQIKPGYSFQDLKRLNHKYNVFSKLEVFSALPAPEQILQSLKKKLVAVRRRKRPDSEKKLLENQIQVQEELIARLARRQKRVSRNVDIPNLNKIYLLECDQGVDLDLMLDEYANNPAVDYAEPNYLCALTMPVNDPYFSSSGSWGQKYNDLWRLKKMDLARAWDIAQGEGTVVAVIDSGVDRNHPDLSANIWNNQGEIPDDGCDNDKNGYIDDAYGFNFVGWYGESSLARGYRDPEDNYGHGTHLAGIIAGVGNNNLGIIGVASKAKIMAVKFTKGEEPGLLLWAVKAIVYAVDNGADVINLSWCSAYSNALAKAIEYAYAKGCVIVGAAGGDNQNALYYPAAFDQVIAVAATDEKDLKCQFSNYGKGIDLSAPGGDANILSLLASNASYYKEHYSNYIVGTQYIRLQGTSMAAPHVAGVCALLLEAFPNDSNEAIRNRIKANVDPLGQDYLGDMGVGRVNAYKALTADKPVCTINKIVLSEQVGDGDGIVESNESANLVLAIKNFGTKAGAVSAKLNLGEGQYVSLIKAEAKFGEIDKDQIKDNFSDPFTFKINTVEIDQAVRFTLSINADGIVQNVIFTINLGIKQIVPDFSEAANPAIYANKIVWQDQRNKNADIYLYDLQTKQEKQITDDTSDQTNPDLWQDTIVWQDYRHGNWDIYCYDLTSKQERRITFDDHEQSFPAIYNKKIVWQDFRCGRNNSDIYMYDLETHQEIRITTDQKEQSAPDIFGKIIVYQDYRFDDQFDIYLYDLDTKKEQCVTNARYNQMYPKIVGDRIVWYDQRNRNQRYYCGDIYSYNLALQREEVVYTGRHEQCAPNLYGSVVVWSDYRRQGDSVDDADIYMYDFATKREMPITSHFALQTNPVLYKDKLVWEDKRDRISRVYLTQLNLFSYAKFLVVYCEDEGEISSVSSK